MTEELIFQNQTFSSSDNLFNFSNILKDITNEQFELFLKFLAEKNNFKNLNLSHNQISDEKFISVFNVIYSNNELEALDVSHNNITDYSIQEIISKLLLQNMVTHKQSLALKIIKLIGNPISQIAIKNLSGVTWIRKELKIYVLEAYLPCVSRENSQIKEIFSDGTVFFDSNFAYQKAKNVEQHREIVLLKVQVPAHAINFECEKDIFNQVSINLLQQFKHDLIIESEISPRDFANISELQNQNDRFSEKFIFKKQNYRIALEYLFRSIKHLESILENRLNQLDITKDGKQYLLIQFLLEKQDYKQTDILNIYLIKQKIAELKQKEISKEELVEISRYLYEISNYLKQSMKDADLLLKEFHTYIENILDNLFIKADIKPQKQKHLKIGVFVR